MDVPIRVLVAEDFDLLREDLCELIARQADMEMVGDASTGKEMVALALQVPHDVILMDIEMESLNAGIQAAEHIVDMKAGEKIIFLTAHETDNMVLTAMGAGGVDYLVKGSGEEVVLQHIRAAHAGVFPLAKKRAKSFVFHQQFDIAHTGGAGAGAPFAWRYESGTDCSAALCGSRHSEKPDKEPAAQVWLHAHQAGGGHDP